MRKTIAIVIALMMVFLMFPGAVMAAPDKSLSESRRRSRTSRPNSIRAKKKKRICLRESMNLRK